MLIPTLAISLICAAVTYTMPVVVINYFPMDGENIDINVTGDWGRGLEFTREKTFRLTKEVIHALEDGSRFRAYKNPDAKSSLKYSVLKTYEFIEAIPTVENKESNSAPMTDYNAIMDRIDARRWVEEEGVKEFWLWGYHGGKIGLWESNMAGPFGDISNSNRDPDDLPVFDQTYIVYHYNYQRGISEAVEDHMHQIEAVLNYVDGRDNTPPDQWNELLFWGKFVGSDKTHKIINPGCGWSHYPPNAESDYDWSNERYAWTDIEDWKPDGSGAKKRINCERWNSSSIEWFIYWMQSLPGKDNGLQYKSKPFANWWIFIGDFDKSMADSMRLINDR